MIEEIKICVDTIRGLLRDIKDGVGVPSAIAQAEMLCDRINRLIKNHENLNKEIK